MLDISFDLLEVLRKLYEQIWPIDRCKLGSLFSFTIVLIPHKSFVKNTAALQVTIKASITEDTIMLYILGPRYQFQWKQCLSVLWEREYMKLMHKFVSFYWKREGMLEICHVIYLILSIYCILQIWRKLLLFLR